MVNTKLRATNRKLKRQIEDLEIQLEKPEDQSQQKMSQTASDISLYTFGVMRKDFIFENSSSIGYVDYESLWISWKDGKIVLKLKFLEKSCEKTHTVVLYGVKKPLCMYFTQLLLKT